MTCSWQSAATVPVHHRFVNESNEHVAYLWLDFQGRPRSYGTLAPGRAIVQSTYSTHPWRFLGESGKVYGEYVGAGSVVTLDDLEQLKAVPWDRDLEQKLLENHPAWGKYGVRAHVSGLEIKAFPCVCEAAVNRACYVVTRMLESSPAVVVKRLIENRSKIAIIGCDQKTTDIPAHHHERFNGNRDVDETARGLGGTLCNPTCSVGEENVLMWDEDPYSMESILVHEFGHSVMNIGLSPKQRERIKDCYLDASRRETYDLRCYMMANAEEYWAEGTQSWFDATLREDVNSGINTREKLMAHDPKLGRLLREAYGDGKWRYPQDSPSHFSPKRRVKNGQRREIDTPNCPKPLVQPDDQTNNHNGGKLPNAKAIQNLWLRLKERNMFKRFGFGTCGGS